MQNIQFQSGAIDAPGCIGNGWNLIKQNYGMYLGIAILGMIIAGCIPCVSLFMVGPIMGGIYFVYLREMSGEPVDFGMMFKGFEKFLPLMVIGIVQSIPEIVAQIFRLTVDIGRIGLTGGGRRNSDLFQSSDAAPWIAGGFLVIVIVLAVVFVIIGAIWRVLLFFAIPLAMEHNLGPMEAMKLSARAATSNVGGLIVLFILEILIGIAGVLALCIGIFFVIPILHAANAFAYRQVFPLTGQAFSPAQPAPQYGSFGQGM